MSTVQIKTATAADKGPAIRTITQAFSADPAARWMFPDAQRYRNLFPSFVVAFAGKAFDQGSAHCVSDGSGTALWLLPGIYPDETALVTLLEEILPVHDRGEVFALFEQMARYHPEEPHWYLPIIGVEPAKQGYGY
ncbi:MAG TPA: hypothetical protein VMT22_12510, partial [Terriglobales bacterium]|nr:hypothetical protein [Terriglobales bacterium]